MNGKILIDELRNMLLTASLINISEIQSKAQHEVNLTLGAQNKSGAMDFKAIDEFDDEVKKQKKHFQIELENLNKKAGLIRPVVLWFSKQMESKLKENDHKDGWKDTTVSQLLTLLKIEVSELDAEIDTVNEIKREDVIKECADIANFALMIADRCGKNIGE